MSDSSIYIVNLEKLQSYACLLLIIATSMHTPCKREEHSASFA